MLEVWGGRKSDTQRVNAIATCHGVWRGHTRVTVTVMRPACGQCVPESWRARGFQVEMTWERRENDRRLQAEKEVTSRAARVSESGWGPGGQEEDIRASLWILKPQESGQDWCWRGKEAPARALKTDAARTGWWRWASMMTDSSLEVLERRGGNDLENSIREPRRNSHVQALWWGGRKGDLWGRSRRGRGPSGTVQRQGLCLYCIKRIQCLLLWLKNNLTQKHLHIHHWPLGSNRHWCLYISLNMVRKSFWQAAGFIPCSVLPIGHHQESVCCGNDPLSEFGQTGKSQ